MLANRAPATFQQHVQCLRQHGDQQQGRAPRLQLEQKHLEAPDGGSKQDKKQQAVHEEQYLEYLMSIVCE